MDSVDILMSRETAQLLLLARLPLESGSSYTSRNGLLTNIENVFTRAGHVQAMAYHVPDS